MTTLTYSTASNDALRDWVYLDSTGIDYDSYIITGYKVHGQGQRQFQGNYVYIFTESNADTSAYARYKWDYFTASSSHRWSSEEQIYRHQSNQTYSIKRLWMRGQGLALQLNIRSDEDAPFTLIGYSMFETGNANS